MIIHKKGSLFNAPEDSILVHACNAQGVWGSGIAYKFAQLYPNAHKEYRNYCKNNNTVGTTLITSPEGNRQVGCLITSNGYKFTVDFPEVILKNTENALEDLFKKMDPSKTLHSNKFNSGLFCVPWEQTEEILNKFVKKYNLSWYVWSIL